MSKELDVGRELDVSKEISSERERKKEINPNRHGSFKINISSDKLKATISLKKGEGTGKPLSLKEVGKAITKAGFKGMDTARVRNDILAFYRSKEMDLLDYLLLEARRSVRGNDGELKYAIEFLSPQEIEELDKKFLSHSSAGRKECEYPAGQSSAGKYSEGQFPGQQKESIENYAFIEKGRKIADIIPPQAGKPGVDIYGKIIAGINGNDPDIKIFNNLQITKNMIVALKSGILETGNKGNTITLHLHLHQDSQIKIKISEDRMQAFISVQPPVGSGAGVTEESLITEIKKQGIVKGINSSMLIKLVSSIHAGEAVLDALIVQGLAPICGSGSRLHFYCKAVSGRSLYIRPESEGKSSAVKKGDLVAEILPPTVKPKDGWDIMGAGIPAKEGLPITIELGKNIRQEKKDDGTVRLFADKNGEVFYNGNLLAIKDTLVIDKDVNNKTGNIKFSGSVIINGTVDTGLKVFSGADINIKNTVGGALISSDGSIFIQEGIRGEGKAVLRSKNSLQTSFIESAIVLTVGDIRIKTSCWHCHVKCNSKIIFKSEDSKLVGGIIKSKKGLEVSNLGSEREVRTEIFFGQDYLVENQIEQEEREIKKLKEKVCIYDKSMYSLEKRGVIDEIDKQKLDELRKEKLKVMRIMDKRSIRLFNLREKYEEHFPSEIVIRKTVYPGVIIESHGRFYEVKRKKKNLIIYFDLEKGKILEKPLN